MTRLLWPLALLCLLSTPALAQGGDWEGPNDDEYEDEEYEDEESYDSEDSSDGDMYLGIYRSEALGGEGEVLQWIEVPEEMGDGAITERDAYALAEFSAWCFDRILQTEDPSIVLGQYGEDRALEFWNYVWEGLDGETLALISVMDQVWPEVRANWDRTDDTGRAEVLDSVVQLVDLVWGDYFVDTAVYFGGESNYEDYIPVMDALLASYYGQAEAVSESGEDGSGALIHDLVSTHLGQSIVYQ